MKLLFLVFHGFSESNGISKKIRYQVEALRQWGVDVRLCYYDVRHDGHRCWMINHQTLADLGEGIFAKLRKRMDFSLILQYVRREEIKAVYVRYDHNANPFTIHFIRRLKEMGCQVVVEIPTYPYDQEYIHISIKQQLDRRFRDRFFHYTNRVVTYSDDTEIFGRPTLRISNGIDFSSIPLRKTPEPATRALHLIAVAEIHFWHGFDRVIEGLHLYTSRHPDYPVHLHIAGPISGPREQHEVADAVTRYHLTDYVHLYGPIHGEALDRLFNRCHLAIGSLGRHRSGITHIKTLKNREYAARGFAFAYSESDTDFDTQPYVLKEPADESPIDIRQLVDFYRHLSMTPDEIRRSIRHLSWEEQMKPIVQYLQSPPNHG